MIALAERIERESRVGQPVGDLLDELHTELDALAHQPRRSPSAANAARRMEEIVAQLTRDSRGGMVRSISGLAAQARNLIAELGREDTTRPAHGYVLT